MHYKNNKVISSLQCFYYIYLILHALKIIAQKKKKKKKKKKRKKNRTWRANRQTKQRTRISKASI